MIVPLILLSLFCVTAAAQAQGSAQGSALRNPLGNAQSNAQSEAQANAQRHPLAPPLSQVAIRINVMGLLPVDGTFDRFDGWFDLDPTRPETCRVRLRIETASLSTTSETVREEAIGPGFLDGARFPFITFDGGCEGDAIVGRLDMHGVTRPFALALDRSGPVGVAAGSLRRTDWGMDERRWVVGETIRITVTTPLLAAVPVAIKR